jgi:hypothetical protein
VHRPETVANVQKPLVTRGGVFVAAQFAETEVTHQAEPMVGSYDDNIELAREITAVLIGRPARPGDNAASMAIRHDRPLARIGGGSPHVQNQAIPIGRWFVAPGGPARLKRRPEFQGIAHTRPALEWRRGFEAVRSGYRAGIGDTAEDRQGNPAFTPNKTVRGLHLDELGLFGLREGELGEYGCTYYCLGASREPVARR